MSRRAVHALLGRRSPLLAVADQLALVAGNALLGILVARSTGMEEFARFALFQALLVLLGFLHVPLVNDPLVLRGAAGAGVPLRAALASSMRLFLPLSVAGALALAALGVGDAVLALLLVPAALLVCLCGSAGGQLSCPWRMPGFGGGRILRKKKGTCLVLFSKQTTVPPPRPL